MKIPLPPGLQYIENDNLLLVAAKALQVGNTVELKGERDERGVYILQLWIERSK
jgi:hypothetical protein